MEYFGSNIDVIRKEVKANRAYSDLFKYKPGLSRSKERFFWKKRALIFAPSMALEKMDENGDWDAIIQDCVSEVVT